MTAEITILDNQTQLVLGEIEVDENAYIYERINGKYTFKFSCYEQQNINLLAQYTLIKVDDDFFRISSIVERPIQKLYEVACEHVSYELNVIPAEEAEEEAEELNYEGPIWEIIPEMLEGTRFTWIPSDNIPDTFEFETKTRGIRSRILEFCIQNKLEANFSKFNVAIQRRRGADNGLEIKLGENLKDLTINKVFNFDNTITTTYDIDFIDLNKIKDAQGNPLKPNEFHMGDTVYLKIGNRSIAQRGVGVGYNPFRRELPTIELESPNRDITEVISDGAVVSGSPSTGDRGIMETGSGPFSEGKEFRFTKPYDKLYSCTPGRTKMANNDPGTDITYSIVEDSNGKIVGVKVHSAEPLTGVTVSIQAVVK